MLNKLQTTVFCIIFIFFHPFLEAQVDSPIQSSLALENFRLGVQSYQQGHYPESILLLEKAIAAAPGNSLIQYWLGRSYYKTGIEDTAISLWSEVVKKDNAPPFLRNHLAQLVARKSVQTTGLLPRYLEVDKISGKQASLRIFSRPTQILPMSNGSFMLIGYGSNELLTIGSNGRVITRNQGGIGGFNGSYGFVSLPDGTIVVSEFNANRLKKNFPQGKIDIVGKRGNGKGEYTGPASLSANSDGYIFVVDYGNKRVIKLNDNLEYILEFGKKIPEKNFPGFVSPTGILAREKKVYVADSLHKSIFLFDDSGNFLQVIAEGEFNKPEGLSYWGAEPALLVADTNRLVYLNLTTEKVQPLYASPNRKARLVYGISDYNDNILVSDFDSSEILFLSDTKSIASGLQVEIENIMSASFPKITINLRVQTHNGKPLVGLQAGNFYITEIVNYTGNVDKADGTIIKSEKRVESVSNLDFKGAADLSSGARILLLADLEVLTPEYKNAFRSTLVSLYNSLVKKNNTIAGMVLVGTTPTFLAGNLSQLVEAIALKKETQKPVEKSLQLAISKLSPASNRDIIIYLGSGQIDNRSITNPRLFELLSFLRNNHVSLYGVVSTSASTSLQYLVENSGGTNYFASIPEGFDTLAATMASIPTGKYSFSFTSKANSDFGRRYLEIAAEAYLYKKSGKDELGYFAPLQ